MDESGADVVGHRCRDVSAGVENSPDIDDLIADDVEHQIREASQRADAEIGNLYRALAKLAMMRSMRSMRTAFGGELA
jgi:hypothetical protein